MFPASKHFDPVVGVDVHIVQPPGPVPPLPVPHPFVGFIMDPMDYLPIIGSTVNINFLPRALAGTQGIAVPPHIPIGGVFVKPPANECECFMGVMTINCDGDALCHASLPALSCQCIGMPPIPRMRKKGAIKSLVLPTSFVMPMPAGPPVIIAGPPTISLMALGMKVGMSGLGKAFKKAKGSALGKKVGAKIDNLKSKFKKKPSSPNKSCGRPGEPVDVVSGANVDSFTDWHSPELAHFKWERFYTSLLSETSGPLGPGFRHTWQHELRMTAEGFSYLDPEGDTVEFPPIDPETGISSNDGFVLRLDEAGRYRLSATMHPTVWFARDDRRTMQAQQLQVENARVTLEYGDQNRLSRLSDDSGNQLRLSYDRNGKLTQLSHGAGQKEKILSSYTYDASGRLTTWTDALDQESRYEYDDLNRLTRKMDRNGYSYHYRYDEEGRCNHSWGDDGLYEIKLEYLTEEQLTVVSWADGARFEYYYDEQGVLAKIVDPSGGVTLFETDDFGNIVKQTEPNGDEVQYLYDQNGAHTRRVDASGQVLLPMHLQPHRPDGLAVELPDTPAAWTLGDLAFNASDLSENIDQLIQQALPADLIQAVGNVDAWEPTATARKLDVLGRVIEEVDSASRPRAYSYDANGNVTRDRDADGSFWTYQYKSWNLVDQERNPIGATTKYDYNIREEVTRVIDAGGTVTEYEYDHCDRITKITRGGKLRERYVYDSGGNLCEKYDASGNLLLKLEPGPYDTHAKIELTDGGSYQYEHTDRARIAAVTGPDHIVKFEYDMFDQVRLDARNGKGVEYLWADSQSQIQKLLGKFEVKSRRTQQGLEVTDPTGAKTTIVADGLGRCLRVSVDGFSELTTYDRKGSCTVQAVKFPNLESWVRSYTHSAAGDLLRTTDSRNGRTEYQYDAAHRLVARRRGGNQEVYHHDLAGNLIAKPGLSGVKIGNANQLDAANDETFTYNERRHISKRVRSDGSTHRYKYNSLDQLIEVNAEDGIRWTAKYDGLNRRISKAWTDGYDSHQVEFYWDHNRLAAEILDGQRLRIYVYADRQSFVPIMLVEYDSRQAEPESGRRYHLLSDQRGQVVEIIDSSGRKVWQADAQPFGEVAPVSDGGFQFHLRLPGQYADDEIGLFYNRHRYYDAQLGRFIQSDPIGLAGGINCYAFPSNPLSAVDLLGLTECGGTSKSTGSRGALEVAEKTAKDFPAVGAKISQKQLRHIKGRPEYRGGGFFDDVADAQKVLDDFNSGNATIVGKTKQGFPVVRVEGVTGTNVNISSGFPNQPTNVFIIKGTKSPSVVPANPNWGG